MGTLKPERGHREPPFDPCDPPADSQHVTVPMASIPVPLTLFQLQTGKERPSLFEQLRKPSRLFVKAAASLFLGLLVLVSSWASGWTPAPEAPPERVETTLVSVAVSELGHGALNLAEAATRHEAPPAVAPHETSQHERAPQVVSTRRGPPRSAPVSRASAPPDVPAEPSAQQVEPDRSPVVPSESQIGQGTPGSSPEPVDTLGLFLDVAPGRSHGGPIPEVIHGSH